MCFTVQLSMFPATRLSASRLLTLSNAARSVKNFFKLFLNFRSAPAAVCPLVFSSDVYTTTSSCLVQALFLFKIKKFAAPPVCERTPKELHCDCHSILCPTDQIKRHKYHYLTIIPVLRSAKILTSIRKIRPKISCCVLGSMPSMTRPAERIL